MHGLYRIKVFLLVLILPLALFGLFTIKTAQVTERAPLPTPTAEIAGTQEPSVVAIKDADSTRVIRIIDGDTVELGNGKIVRLIGIDAPETDKECFSAESKARLEALTLNKQVRLEKDKSENDRYNRLLRYIWIGDEFVNETMVREGFAKSLRYPPDVRHQARIAAAEAAARQHKSGVWSEQCSEPVTTKTPPANNGGGAAPHCSSNTYNCTDFSTCDEAKAILNACATDVHKIDQDGDGIPCEALCSG